MQGLPPSHPPSTCLLPCTLPAWGAGPPYPQDLPSDGKNAGARAPDTTGSFTSAFLDFKQEREEPVELSEEGSFQEVVQPEEFVAIADYSATNETQVAVCATHEEAVLLGGPLGLATLGGSVRCRFRLYGHLNQKSYQN